MKNTREFSKDVTDSILLNTHWYTCTVTQIIYHHIHHIYQLHQYMYLSSVHSLTLLNFLGFLGFEMNYPSLKLLTLLISLSLFELTHVMVIQLSHRWTVWARSLFLLVPSITALVVSITVIYTIKDAPVAALEHVVRVGCPHLLSFKVPLQLLSSWWCLDLKLAAIVNITLKVWLA